MYDFAGNIIPTTATTENDNPFIVTIIYLMNQVLLILNPFETDYQLLRLFQLDILKLYRTYIVQQVFVELVYTQRNDLTSIISKLQI